MNLLDIENLVVTFATDEGVVRAVDRVSFSIGTGETIGVVGESGCGKSVTALSIMRLIPDPPGKIVSGEILFAAKIWQPSPEHEMRKIRGNDIAMIFQEPMTSLNPVFTIGYQIAERSSCITSMSTGRRRGRAVEMLEHGGHPRPPRGGRTNIPTILRRHAPAGDDRHGAVAATRSC